MADSLDLDEVNRTRVALGMAPIPVPNSTSNLEFKTSGSAGGSSKEDLGSTLESREAEGFDNWKKVQDAADDKKRREARRDALKKERDAALRFTKLEGKGLGDADVDEVDTRSWLLASNKRQKKIAKNRARALEQELADRENQAQYTEKDLAGMKVGHELGDFDEGMEQIITLKDQAVDAEDDEDVLENADLTAREKLAEKLQLKKRKPVYDPNKVDETGERTLLAQYDEEIDGKKQKRFTLDGQGRTVEQASRAVEDLSKSQGMKFTLDFLQDEKPISDYMDVSEIKMRKPKKKKEKSKRQKAQDDMFAGEEISGTGPNSMDIENAQHAMDIETTQHAALDTSSNKRRIDEATFVDDDDLQSSLALQRRAALKKRKMTRPEDIARQFREEASATPMDTTELAEDDGGLVIDETSEFVANLQKPEAPAQRTSSTKPFVAVKPETSNSPSPVRDHDEDVEMPESYDIDEATKELEARLKRESSTTGGEDRTATGLDEESTLDHGVGAALAMLTQRGLLKTAGSGDLNAQHRERQHFLHEKQQRESEASNKARLQRERDRASGKFERMSAREREQYAQWENKQRDQQDSRHMAEVFNREYKPVVELKYTDEHGRSMNQREAFKHLSHQFHGKGSGKQKTEKTLKKIEDEKKREAMSSLDSSQSTGMNSAMGATARKNRQAGVRLQ